MSDQEKREGKAWELYHPLADTVRPDTPELEGALPLPEEVIGRASGTGDSLPALFGNEIAAHLADGFRGGSGDKPHPVNQADGAAFEEDDGA